MSAFPPSHLSDLIWAVIKVPVAPLPVLTSPDPHTPGKFYIPSFPMRKGMQGGGKPKHEAGKWRSWAQIRAVHSTPGHCILLCCSTKLCVCPFKTLIRAQHKPFSREMASIACCPIQARPEKEEERKSHAKGGVHQASNRGDSAERTKMKEQWAKETLAQSISCLLKTRREMGPALWRSR